MRIRTIKPEFWSHPVMARQDDGTKLLAIGLLNFADDEGYFYATPSLIRSALRPFDDDSSIVRRSLESLSKIGFIEIRDHSTHGPVGLVLSFSHHQRVDRAKESIIKQLFDSTSDRRTIDESSSLERKGTGNREQGMEGKENMSGSPDALSALVRSIWDAAPSKARTRSSLKDCEAAMRKVKVSDRPTAEKALEAIKAWGECDDWTKESGQFIPGLHRWIKAEQWKHLPEKGQKDFTF